MAGKEPGRQNPDMGHVAHGGAAVFFADLSHFAGGFRDMDDQGDSMFPGECFGPAEKVRRT